MSFVGVFSGSFSADGAATVRINGKEVAAFEAPPAPPAPLFTTPLRCRALSDTVLADSKLCVERARKLQRELVQLIDEWLAKAPVKFYSVQDPQTGEIVCHVAVEKPLPRMAAAVAGDVLQNLRAALDIMVCDLIRANNQQPTGDSGFPAAADAARAAKKVKGASARAEKFIVRLKAAKRWNDPIWLLHNLNRLHKHNKLVVVSAATVGLIARVDLPFISFGSGPIHQGGVPTNFRTTVLGDGDNQVYRCPAHVDQQVKIDIGIVFGGEGRGEAVLPALFWVTELVARILTVCERRVI